VNLTETATFFKRAAVIGIIFFFGFFFFKFTFTFVKAIYLRINPLPAPPVTTIFGKLPPLSIPKLKIEGAENITYSIDTPTGSFPNLPAQAAVYQIPHPGATLLSESRARALARSLTFTNEPTRVSSSDLHWDDIQSSRSLDINIVTGNFSLKTDYAKLAFDLTPGSAPTQAQAINLTLGFFTNKQMLSADYLQGNQTTTLMKLITGQPHEAGSLSEAQITKVGLFRQVDKLNIWGPNPKEGLITMEVTANQGVQLYPNITYNAWNLDTEKVGKYPLKSVEKAFSELKSGQGAYTYLKLRGQDLFASYSPLNISNISIRTVEVAYYDNSNLQNYLQPIYVFSGIIRTSGGSEGDFIAYVPAIDISWTEISK